MSIKGNKGEWSEIYTLFKLLGEGLVYAGDAQMNKMDLFYPIVNIIRNESLKHEYFPNKRRNIVIIKENGDEVVKIPMMDFLRESQNLLKTIKNSHDGPFEAIQTETFMQRAKCDKLKAPSKDKADIHIVLHDPRTEMDSLLGFSIKSQLGSPSTLLNSSIATNFTYNIVGARLSDSQIDEINMVQGHLPRMQAILDAGCKLQFCGIEHPTFNNNLLFLDSAMPLFLAECLKYANMPDNSLLISDVVHHIATCNPLNYPGQNVDSFYQHKMKVLLLDAALGMTPSKEWNGYYDANGGYLVVRQDGEIVCYHFYNRNQVEDYLFYNTRFDRPSRSRHNYGTIYKANDGTPQIKLNIQIRFTK